MLKKILIVLSVMLIIAGAGGTIYFKLEMDKKINENYSLQTQNAQVQQALDAIGQMTEVYQVSGNRYSGDLIIESDLITVSVPVSSLGETSVTSKSDIVGKYYKVDVRPGTQITTDLLMKDNTEIVKYTKDIPLNYMPVTTKVGDYIDLRLMLPNGEDYIVLSHKRIELITEAVMTIFLSEEELQIYNAACLDYATYALKGVVLYVTKYLEPGKDTNTVAFYPVQHEMEEMIKYNVNISDETRCINTNLRDHIDYVLFVSAITENDSVASSVNAFYNSHSSVVNSAQTKWLQDVEQGKTEQIGVTGNQEGDSGSFDQAVGDTANSIDEGMGDMMGDSQEDTID